MGQPRHRYMAAPPVKLGGVQIRHIDDNKSNNSNTKYTNNCTYTDDTTTTNNDNEYNDNDTNHNTNDTNKLAAAAQGAGPPSQARPVPSTAPSRSRPSLLTFIGSVGCIWYDPPRNPPVHINRANYMSLPPVVQ